MLLFYHLKINAYEIKTLSNRLSIQGRNKSLKYVALYLYWEKAGILMNRSEFKTMHKRFKKPMKKPFNAF